MNQQTKTSIALAPCSSDSERRRHFVSLAGFIRDVRLSISTMANLFIHFGWDEAAVRSFLHKRSIIRPRPTSSPLEHRSELVSACATFVCDGVHIRSFGRQGSELGELVYPRRCALSVDACYLYVADSGNHRVCVFDASSGAYRHSFGSQIFEPMQFHCPVGLFVSDRDQLYVCDSGNHRVQVLDAVTGAYIRTIGTGVSGSAAVLLYKPVGVVTSRQRVYVCEWGNDRVSVFNESDGAFLHTFSGSGDGQFVHCCYIAASALSGDVYVVDVSSIYDCRVQVFSETGEFLRVLCNTKIYGGLIQSVRGLTVSVTGDVYLVDMLRHCIHIIDSSGKHLRSFDSRGIGDRTLSRCTSVAVSRDGRVFALDQEQNHVRVFE